MLVARATFPNDEHEAPNKSIGCKNTYSKILFNLDSTLIVGVELFQIFHFSTIVCSKIIYVYII